MPTTNIRLSDLLEADHIIDLDVSTNKEEALRTLGRRLAEDPRVLDSEVFVSAILQREALASTGVGMGIAIPHVKIPEVKDYVTAVGRSRQGIPYDAMDGQPVHLIFMIGASESQTRDFVRILARVTYLLKDETIRSALLDRTRSANVLVDYTCS